MLHVEEDSKCRENSSQQDMSPLLLLFGPASDAHSRSKLVMLALLQEKTLSMLSEASVVAREEEYQQGLLESLIVGSKIHKWRRQGNH
jgi:hypothetical protein